ncbi:hypothetical protein BC832DRAFT_552132 [Gaertneriomyces semiglobifer]|nr:hypothetical protein BC832DRAFT_552132 [Gaertneriomyces semiglobifer]
MSSTSPSPAPTRTATRTRAVITIQHHVRRFLTRLHLRTRTNAAILLQKHIRGFLVRRRYKRLLSLHAQSRAIDKDLCRTRNNIVWKEKQLRELANVHASRLIEGRWEEQKRHQAAKVVQKLWRGKLARKQVEVLRRQQLENSQQRQPPVNKPIRTETVHPTPEEVAEIHQIIINRLHQDQRRRLLEQPEPLPEKEVEASISHTLSELRRAIDEFNADSKHFIPVEDLEEMIAETDKYVEFLSAGDTLASMNTDEYRELSESICIPDDRKGAIRASHLAALKAAKNEWWKALAELEKHGGYTLDDVDEILAMCDPVEDEHGVYI